MSAPAPSADQPLLPLALVIGGTGLQGAGCLQDLRNSGRFRLRNITRNAKSKVGSFNLCDVCASIVFPPVTPLPNPSLDLRLFLPPPALGSPRRARGHEQTINVFTCLSTPLPSFHSTPTHSPPSPPHPHSPPWHSLRRGSNSFKVRCSTAPS